MIQFLTSNLRFSICRPPFMKPRFLVLFLTIAVCPAFASAPPSGPPTSKAEIAKLVAGAASYQPGQSCEAFRRIEELVAQPSPKARPQLEAGLVQLLAPSATFEARRFACKQLGIIGSKTALPALSLLLTNDETAGIACLALTTYPPGRADEILRDALMSAAGTARIQIINTLGDRRDSKAVKVLVQLAADADLSTAKAAIAALGKIADQSAWKAIAAMPVAAGPALQPGLTEALLRYAEAHAASGDTKTAAELYEELMSASQPTYVRRAALDGLLRVDKAQAEQRILQVLHGPDLVLKPVAIADVRVLPSTNASVVFAGELVNLTPQEQIWMIDSLAARGDAPACKALGDCLASPDAGVRRAAISALGRMGNAWCVALFARALDHFKDAQDRRALESALVSLPGGAQTDRAIVDALKKSSGETRGYLITALAQRQGPAANPLLLVEAGQSDPVVAKAALRALAKTATARDVTPLLDVLTKARDGGVRSEAQHAAAQALPRVDNPGRRSALVREAQGWAQSADSRVALLGLMPACGDATALVAVKAAAVSSDTVIRDAGVAALADWPDGSAWDALEAIYRQPATEAVREVALRGLVRLVGEENAHPSIRLGEHYRVLLEGARDDADLRLILGALGDAALPGALKLALPLLDNTGVRAEAEVAVRKIAEAIKVQDPKAAQEALSRLQKKP
jgi:HEAT repeat protein